MKLISATTSKYRSIVRAHKIPFSEKTILIGPNNEGKTNILNALVLAMEALDASGRYLARSSPPTLLLREIGYEWEQDYPIQLQLSQPAGKTEITLEFQFNEGEFSAFHKKIGNRFVWQCLNESGFRT